MCSAGMDCPRVRDTRLVDAVQTCLLEDGLKVLTEPGNQLDKVLQLSEVMPHKLIISLVSEHGQRPVRMFYPYPPHPISWPPPLNTSTPFACFCSI